MAKTNESECVGRNIKLRGKRRAMMSSHLAKKRYFLSGKKREINISQVKPTIDEVLSTNPMIAVFWKAFCMITGLEKLMIESATKTKKIINPNQ